MRNVSEQPELENTQFQSCLQPKAVFRPLGKANELRLLIAKSNLTSRFPRKKPLLFIQEGV